MPRKGSAAERASAKAFVRELFERSRFETQAELAVEMHVLANQVSEWLNPKRDELPDAVNLVKMIRVTGVLDWTTTEQAEPDGEVSALREALAEATERVDRLALRLHPVPARARPSGRSKRKPA
jgi:hypothetical protein